MVLSNAQWFNKTEAYTIDDSCRFNDDDSSYLYRTPSEASNSKTWTASMWIKRGNLGDSVSNVFFAASESGLTTSIGTMDAGDYDRLYINMSGSTGITTQVFRDPAAWFHLHWAMDTTQSTASDRMKLSINGVQVTAFDSITYPAEDHDTTVNKAEFHGWARNSSGGNQWYDGYLAACYLIDGIVTTPSDFGEVSSSTGQWIPKAYGGSFGTNGFYLAFQDSSALGDDTSGEGNDFTSSGLAANDQRNDTPTSNRATFTPLSIGPNQTLSDGNLKMTAPSGTTGSWNIVLTTMGITQKTYWEVVSDEYSNTGFNLMRESGNPPGGGLNASAGAFGVGVTNTEQWVTGSVANESSGVITFPIATDDVVNIAFDPARGAVWYGIDGTWKDGTASSASSSTILSEIEGSGTDYAIFTGLSTSYTWIPAIATYSNNTATLRASEADQATSLPSGYIALDPSETDDPTIANPTEYFETVLYTGSGSEKAITSLEFSPDFVWLKNRETTDQHNLIDTVRGATKEINSDNHQVESTVAQGLKSFDSNGFTLGTDLEYNTDTETYVSWNWLESVTAGFDIVGWTGDGESSKTLSHNLGVVPDVMMVKNRDGANSWRNFHSKMASDPQTDHMVLDTNLGVADDGYGASSWNDTMPTSSNFYVGDSGSVNTDTEDYIAYLWANVEGFSKLGSYTGNGNVDGPFVWCGLSPSFVMTKGTAAGNWKMWDNKRIPYNVITTSLAADTTAADNTGTAQYIDFLSNGFKIRGSDTATNGDDYLYIFMAFAESPFKTANAR